MGFDVSTYMSNGLVDGGARPALFDVALTLPPNITGNSLVSKFNFTCEGSELPAATIGTVLIPYFGRKIKSPGDRTFADWSVTVQNDEDFGVRSMFEAWSNYINSFVGNLRDPSYLSEVPASTTASSTYKVNLTITQYSKTGGAIRSYVMTGAWPADIGAIRVNWNSTDQYETFEVRFAYDWWDILAATNGNPSTTVAFNSGA